MIWKTKDPACAKHPAKNANDMHTPLSNISAHFLAPSLDTKPTEAVHSQPTVCSPCTFTSPVIIYSCSDLVVVRFHSPVCFINHNFWYFLLWDWYPSRDLSDMHYWSIWSWMNLCRYSRFVELCGMAHCSTGVLWCISSQIILLEVITKLQSCNIFEIFFFILERNNNHSLTQNHKDNSYSMQIWLLDIWISFICCSSQIYVKLIFSGDLLALYIPVKTENT